MSTWRILMVAFCAAALYAAGKTKAEPDSSLWADARFASGPLAYQDPALPPPGPPGDREDMRRGWGEGKKSGERRWPEDRRRGPESWRGPDDRRGPEFRDQARQDDKGGDRDFNLPPDEVDRLMDFTREHFPRVHDKLLQARGEDPRNFQHMLRRLGPPMMRLMNIARENPQEAEQLIRMQKLEVRLYEARQRYRDARTDEARDQIRSEVRDLIEQKFEARQQRLKIENEELRRRLTEQEQRYADQYARKPQIIEEEVKRAFEKPRGFHGHHRPGSTPTSDE